jgi:4-diphosphocytidyl-2-C-methyl-D-erythritol kinase
MESARYRFASPAKVNFGLRILGKRPDGYHAIQTIFQMLDLCDWLTFRPNDEGTISLTCNTPALPADDRNLAVRAAKLLQRELPVRRGVEITLDKHIPIAAGLGGGSSNAGIVLHVLNRLWKVDCPMMGLHHLAAQLGSDVPFFLNGPMAVAEGRGDVLSSASPAPRLTGILLNPGFGVPAGSAYNQFSGRSLATDLTIPTVLRALMQQDLGLLADAMVNDLEPGVAAAYSVIRAMHDSLQAVGALVTFMSGSGPSVGGLFASPTIREEAMVALGRQSAWTVLPFSTLSESPHPELQG